MGLLDNLKYAPTYTQNEFEQRYQLQVGELNQTRNIAELGASIALYMRNAQQFGEPDAIPALFELYDVRYNEFLRYNHFDYADARKKMFAIVHKYRLNRENLGQTLEQKWIH